MDFVTGLMIEHYWLPLFVFAINHTFDFIFILSVIIGFVAGKGMSIEGELGSFVSLLMFFALILAPPLVPIYFLVDWVLNYLSGEIMKGKKEAEAVELFKEITEKD